MSKGFKQKRKTLKRPDPIIAFGHRFHRPMWYIAFFAAGLCFVPVLQHQLYWTIAFPIVAMGLSWFLGKLKPEPPSDAPAEKIEQRAMHSGVFTSAATWGEYLRRKILIAGLDEIPFHVQSRLRTLDRYQLATPRDALVGDYDFEEAKATVDVYLTSHRIDTEANLAVNRFEGSMMPGPQNAFGMGQHRPVEFGQHHPVAFQHNPAKAQDNLASDILNTKK